MTFRVLSVLLLLPFAHTVAAQPRPKPLLAYRALIFDSVKLSSNGEGVALWTVKNVSDSLVMFFDVVDVWNDCPISDHWVRPFPLPPGEERTVRFLLHWFPRGIGYHKRGGSVGIPFNFQGRDTMIQEFVSLGFYEDSAFFYQRRD